MQKIGIAHYSEENYRKLLKCADDRNALDDHYINWLKNYTKTLNELKKNGLNVEPFEIEINVLMEWCKKNNLSNTGESRSRFVAAMLQEGDKQKNPR